MRAALGHADELTGEFLHQSVVLDFVAPDFGNFLDAQMGPDRAQATAPIYSRSPPCRVAQNRHSSKEWRWCRNACRANGMDSAT